MTVSYRQHLLLDLCCTYTYLVYSTIILTALLSLFSRSLVSSGFCVFKNSFACPRDFFQHSLDLLCINWMEFLICDVVMAKEGLVPWAWHRNGKGSHSTRRIVDCIVGIGRVASKTYKSPCITMTFSALFCS